ncbi:MAG: response regulator [Thermoproteota archaeon]|nr:response regulator [Thermoproteota archaeon]
MTSSSLSHQEQKKNILIVDNEPDMTSLLKMALERVGFIIDAFNDPVLALKSFKPNLYDLVLLDVMMPEMDGFELYDQLKKMDPGIKVCFLTASTETYREELSKEKYREISKDLFLEMPLPLNEIITEVKKRIDLS